MVGDIQDEVRGLRAVSLGGRGRSPEHGPLLAAGEEPGSPEFITGRRRSRQGLVAAGVRGRHDDDGLPGQSSRRRRPRRDRRLPARPAVKQPLVAVPRARHSHRERLGRFQSLLGSHGSTTDGRTSWPKSRPRLDEVRDARPPRVHRALGGRRRDGRWTSGVLRCFGGKRPTPAVDAPPGLPMPADRSCVSEPAVLPPHLGAGGAFVLGRSLAGVRVLSGRYGTSPAVSRTRPLGLRRK